MNIDSLSPRTPIYAIRELIITQCAQNVDGGVNAGWGLCSLKSDMCLMNLNESEIETFFGEEDKTYLRIEIERGNLNIFSDAIKKLCTQRILKITRVLFGSFTSEGVLAGLYIELLRQRNIELYQIDAHKSVIPEDKAVLRISLAPQALKLKKLNLACIDLSDDHIHGIKGVFYLIASGSLLSLTLSHCNVGPNGARLLFLGLAGNHSITFFSMGSQEDIRIADLVGKMLFFNSTLKVLLLPGWGFEGEGDELVLANGLFENSSLTYLDLGYRVRFNGTEGKYLEVALQTNKTLQDFAFWEPSDSSDSGLDEDDDPGLDAISEPEPMAVTRLKPLLEHNKNLAKNQAMNLNGLCLKRLNLLLPERLNLVLPDEESDVELETSVKRGRETDEAVSSEPEKRLKLT
jgi:hypothetical protein